MRAFQIGVASVLLFCCVVSLLSESFSLPIPLHYAAEIKNHVRPLAFLSTPRKFCGTEMLASSSSSSSWTADNLDQLKQSVDIVAAISSYDLVKFQRKGVDAAVAICPFHDDNNPSLSIDGRRRMYKCFSCGAGGDIFRFVHDYSKLPGNEEMSFYQAVKYVADKFSSGGISLAPRGGSPRKNKLDEFNSTVLVSKDRILQANAAAASFYFECLITMPEAGRARSHLRARGLSPFTVRAFVLGYAPDAYYQPGKQWGSGSLVNHMQELGFSAKELIGAGLATQTKASHYDAASVEPFGETLPESVARDDEIEFNSLMDKFRGRLVVPIFDTTGQNVLGFGGRLLPSLNTDIGDRRSSFKAPKYLNSPESAVFQKKRILFGQHIARHAIRAKATKDYGPSIVIVEGYMDAISLWNAGIREAVACMGTALSMEQLAAAAKLSGLKGGRIILCLDADNAGVAASERLSSNQVLATTAELYGVSILIATIPDGIKDPAEFMESKPHANQETTAAEFREKVLECAQDWSSWYTLRILSSYNSTEPRGTGRTFGQVFDRLAEFLSSFPNPAERTKRAAEVAFALTAKVAEESKSDFSNAIHLQLETDLIDATARKASAREAIQRRIGSIDKSLQGKQTLTLAKLSQGMEASLPQNYGKMPFISPETEQPTHKYGDAPIKEQKTRKGPKNKASLPRVNRAPQAPKKRVLRDRAATVTPLSPHFTGFKFENQADGEWLGPRTTDRQSDKNALVLGLDRTGKAKSGVVFFNSNSYHGHQFLTDSAVNAGYLKSAVPRDLSVFEKGVSSLLHQDAHTLVLAAEEKFLRILVSSVKARSVMKNLLAAKVASESSASHDWSCPEREWLFSRLVGNLPTCKTKDELRSHLFQLADTPPGAFKPLRSVPSGGTLWVDNANVLRPAAKLQPLLGSESTLFQSTSQLIERTENLGSTGPVSPNLEPTIDVSPSKGQGGAIKLSQRIANSEVAGAIAGRGVQIDGCLDCLFTGDPRDDEVLSDQEADHARVDLFVQESYTSMLSAFGTYRLWRMRNEWVVAHYRLKTMETDKDTHWLQPEAPPRDGSRLEADAQRKLCETLAVRANEAAQTVQELHDGTKRMASRLLDFSSASNREGRASFAQRRALSATLDEMDQAFGDGSFIGEDDENENESVNDALGEIDEEWGEWAEDGFEWSPQMMSSFTRTAPWQADLLSDEDDDDGDDESVEEALVRLEREWGDYCNAS